MPLRAGQNTIEAAQLDSFGNEHGTLSINVVAPGRAGKLIIEAPASASADGATGVPFVLRLVDARGLPATARAPVTLETASSRFDLEDLNEREPGPQIFIEGGVAKGNLIAPADPFESPFAKFRIMVTTCRDRSRKWPLVGCSPLD